MSATRHRAAWALIVGAVIVSLGFTLDAQRRGRQRGGGGFERFQQGGQIHGNIPYYGRFTFVRLSYRNFGRGGDGWVHDYPRGDEHFMKIINAVTLVNPHGDGETNILGLDDPELFNYPIAYMSEPGYWTMSEAELAGLTAYIAKGGFLIFDDFRQEHWYNFELQMNRVFPKAIWHQLTADHPIFHSFYDIGSLDLIPQYFNYGTPKFYGLFEDNDPTKRMIAIANYDTDLSEFWEFSDSGARAIEETNEAFKLGVNYIIYGMTH